jgi:hypothetical protein
MHTCCVQCSPGRILFPGLPDVWASGLGDFFSLGEDGPAAGDDMVCGIY